MLTNFAASALIRLLAQTLRRAVDDLTDAVVLTRVGQAWAACRVDDVRGLQLGRKPLTARTPPLPWRCSARALTAVTGTTIRA